MTKSQKVVFMTEKGNEVALLPSGRSEPCQDA